MPFDKGDVRLAEFSAGITFNQFGYLKRCLDGLKDLGVTQFDRELFTEGRLQSSSS